MDGLTPALAARWIKMSDRLIIEWIKIVNTHYIFPQTLEVYPQQNQGCHIIHPELDQ